jgi:hypothetical protein
MACRIPLPFRAAIIHHPAIDDINSLLRRRRTASSALHVTV